MHEGIRSLTYITKVSGPSQVPCDIPPTMSAQPEYRFPSLTRCFRDWRHENIQPIKQFETPKYVILFSSML